MRRKQNIFKRSIRLDTHCSLVRLSLVFVSEIQEYEYPILMKKNKNNLIQIITENMDWKQTKISVLKLTKYGSGTHFFAYLFTFMQSKCGKYNLK